MISLDWDKSCFEILKLRGRAGRNLLEQFDFTQAYISWPKNKTFETTSARNCHLARQKFSLPLKFDNLTLVSHPQASSKILNLTIIGMYYSRIEI